MKSSEGAEIITSHDEQGELIDVLVSNERAVHEEMSEHDVKDSKELTSFDKGLAYEKGDKGYIKNLRKALESYKAAIMLGENTDIEVASYTVMTDPIYRYGSLLLFEVKNEDLFTAWKDEYITEERLSKWSEEIIEKFYGLESVRKDMDETTFHEALAFIFDMAKCELSWMFHGSTKEQIRKTIRELADKSILSFLDEVEMKELFEMTHLEDILKGIYIIGNLLEVKEIDKDALDIQEYFESLIHDCMQKGRQIIEEKGFKAKNILNSTVTYQEVTPVDDIGEAPITQFFNSVFATKYALDHSETFRDEVVKFINQSRGETLQYGIQTFIKNWTKTVREIEAQLIIKV